MTTTDIYERTRRAWNAIRREHQPLYDELEQSYRDGLTTRTERVIADRVVFETTGVFAEFERYVLEELIPERFHPDNPAPLKAVEAVKQSPSRHTPTLFKGGKVK